MHTVLTRLMAAAVAALFVLMPASVHAQAAAPAAQTAIVPARAAALDQAALEQKVDELLKAHVSVNDFSGTILLARDGRPLVMKGYGFANIEWQIPNTPQTKFRI